jgi:hypothetical protein
VCTDTDGDTVCDEVDNCVDVANQNQNDTDGDGIGDICEGACEWCSTADPIGEISWLSDILINPICPATVKSSVYQGEQVFYIAYDCTGIPIADHPEAVVYDC